jgi:RNA polymerase sigma-70 factor (ECF subfamily)
MATRERARRGFRGRPSRSKKRLRSAGVPRRRTPEFTDLYDEQVWRVYGFFGYRLASREEAEDLTQLTFERALKAWARYDASRASTTTWILTIARNLLIDHFRRDLPVAVERIEDLVPAAEDSISDHGLGVTPELELALRTLSDRDRELIALRYGGDLSGPEISEMTGLSLANVQQILSRSLRKLRLELEGAGGEESGSGREWAGAEQTGGAEHQQGGAGAAIQRDQ